ncbi:hypothetical protein [Embleya sp. NPDC020630]|uniref:preATP grasp domain-containing protein n=1 Tax=Embleya sp. NPDC020630 TaxID=3363979 RepID=UPI00379252DC
MPDTPHLPMAQAVTAHGLLEPLRTLVRERPQARLLPIALDVATVRLAAATSASGSLRTRRAGHGRTCSASSRT